MSSLLRFLILLIILSFVLAPGPVRAQYAYTLGGPGFDEGMGVGLDAEGNAYFIGEFDGTFDFDPGTGTAPLSSTQRDVYVVSYDPGGAFRFAFQIGNAFATTERAGGIAVNDIGDFVVTGSQPFGPIDYDPDPNATASRTGQLFIAGYDADGTFRFAITPQARTTASSGRGNAVALDAASNAYVAGQFVGTIDFSPGQSGAGTLTSGGSIDAFIASYTTAGDLRFAFGLGSTSADEGLGIAADDAGNVYVTGSFRNTVAFDPSDTNSDGDLEERTAAASGSAFLASYTTDGTFRFAYALGEAIGEGLTIGASGNAYLTGTVTGTALFDPEDSDGDGDLKEHTADGNRSAFLARYTPNGVSRFVAVVSGGSSVGRAVDTLGDPETIFFTGSFSGIADFDYTAGTDLLDAGAGTDVFVASYDVSGTYRETFAYGGDGLSTGNGIAMDAVGASVLTGGFSNTTDFDPGSNTDNRTSAGQNDLFMARYLVGGVLPVELVSFEAVTDGDGVLLRWMTAGETDNAGFNVQQRTDDRAWQSLTFIEGHGSTTEPRTYQHRVADPEPGRHRFRLRQVDLDGTFAYSPEIEVAVNLASAFSLTPPHPNPFSVQAQFTLSVQQAQRVRITVYDVLGRRVARLHDGVLSEGTMHRFAFDGAGWASGLYLLQVEGEQFQETLRAVLVR